MMQHVLALHPKPSVCGPVKTIVFDLGNVLLDINIDRVLQKMTELGIRKINSSDLYPHNTGVFTQLELGLITEAEFVKAIQASVEDGSEIPSHHAVIEAWNSVFDPYDWQRFHMLDRLRHAGYRLLVLSNTNEPHHVFFEEDFNSKNPVGRTFASYFDAVYYSDEMQMNKPNLDIYQAVLERESICASETLFIDDAILNVEAAAKLGIQVYHLEKGQYVLDLFE